MNNEQIKEKLLLLDSEVDEFYVVLSGKSSKRVDGLYHPDTREIIIHNKNFNGDNALMYTAIHEFAHHVHHYRSTVPLSPRSHTGEFWSIFHHLLNSAIEKGIYINAFSDIPEFTELTRKIKQEYLQKDAELMKDFGGLLMEAYRLCREHQVSFDDYVDRELGFHRSIAKNIMKIHNLDVNPAVGYENMKLLSRIKDNDRRRDAENALQQGNTVDMVRQNYIGVKKNVEPLEQLESEKKRISRTIENLTGRLMEIEDKIRELKHTE